MFTLSPRDPLGKESRSTAAERERLAMPSLLENGRISNLAHYRLFAFLSTEDYFCAFYASQNEPSITWDKTTKGRH